jgi:hypothetical protein
LGEPTAEKTVSTLVDQSEYRKVVNSVGCWVDWMVVESVAQLVSSMGMNSVERLVVTTEQQTGFWKVDH